jgi:phosphoribosylaminoimidazolecarboxamide formyltransferase / IMP cyclohydrolase
MNDRGNIGSLLTFTVGTRSYEHLEELKYGTNPHHKCVRLRSDGYRGLFTIADQRADALSATNMHDIDLGLRMLLPYRESPAIALVKHVNPTGIAVGHPGATAPEVFRTARAADPDATHGTVITTCRVDSSLGEELLAHPAHVLAAPGFTADAHRLLGGDEFYARMRSLRLVEIDTAPSAGGEDLQASLLVDGSLLVEWHDTAAPPERSAVRNPPPAESAWTAASFGYHVALHCRTLSAVAVCGLTVVAMASGYANSLHALEAVLGTLSRRRHLVDESLPLVLASDGHFAVVDPVPLLRRHGIKYFVAAGGKAEDDDLISRAAAAGVHVTLTGRRAFRH